MFMTPAAVILSWFRGFLAIAIAGAGIWLLVRWYDTLPQVIVEKDIVSDARPADARPERASESRFRERKLSHVERITHWRPRFDPPTAMLVAGAALMLWTVAGRFLRGRLLILGEPVPVLPPAEVQRLTFLNGAEIHVELRGSSDVPTVILTHGWSLSSHEWAYFQKEWDNRVRTITWDLPGLGKSTQPTDRNFSLENLALCLRNVIDATTSGPVILVGHSIGGMIILTFCKLFPELLGSRITKLVLIHTTYVNPLRTMAFSRIVSALQKPVIEPLLYLQIAFSPVVRILNWMSYWNGSIHASVIRNGFAGTESRSQVDFVAHYYPIDSPAVLARGCLGMLEYDVTSVLPSITIPVLVVGGNADPITLNEASKKISATLPSGRITVLAPAKHFGLIEYHAEVAKQLEGYFSGRPTT